MEEFKSLVLGEVSVACYLAAELFALLALIVSLYLHSFTRDVKSPNTPVEFSWMFLITDNVKRIVVGQIVLFLLFRFTSEYIGRSLNMKTAVAIGFLLSFGIDKAIQFLKDRFNILAMPRKENES